MHIRQSKAGLAASHMGACHSKMIPELLHPCLAPGCTCLLEYEGMPLLILLSTSGST